MATVVSPLRESPERLRQTTPRPPRVRQHPWRVDIVAKATATAPPSIARGGRSLQERTLVTSAHLCSRLSVLDTTGNAA